MTHEVIWRNSFVIFFHFSFVHTGWETRYEIFSKIFGVGPFHVVVKRYQVGIPLFLVFFHFKVLTFFNIFLTFSREWSFLTPLPPSHPASVCMCVIDWSNNFFVPSWVELTSIKVKVIFFLAFSHTHSLSQFWHHPTILAAPSNSCLFWKPI